MMCQSNFFLILHYSAAASLSLFTMKRKMERFAIITFDCKQKMEKKTIRVLIFVALMMNIEHDVDK